MSNIRELETEAERLVRHAATDRLPVDAGVIAQVTGLIREAREQGQVDVRLWAVSELQEARDDPAERQELEAFLRRLDSYGVPRCV